MPLYAHDHLVHKLKRSGLLDAFQADFYRLTSIRVVFREIRASENHTTLKESNEVKATLRVGVVDLGYIVVSGRLSEEKAASAANLLKMAAFHLAAKLSQPMEGSEKAIPSVILAATEIVRNRFQQSIRLSDLAKELKISAERLSRLFHESLGVTYSDYLNEVRLDHCKNLLRNTRKPITEVALESGFQSISQFNRRFRASEGISPRQFRDAYQFSEFTMQHIL